MFFKCNMEIPTQDPKNDHYDILFVLYGLMEGLRLPAEICEHIVRCIEPDDVVLKCATCGCALLTENRSVPFSKGFPVVWSCDSGPWLLTDRGKLLMNTGSISDPSTVMHLKGMMGLLTPPKTPLHVCANGVCFENICRTLSQHSWYKTTITGGAYCGDCVGEYEG